MAIVAPSILSADFGHLSRDLQTIRSSGCAWAHVDVMDGLFVPNISLGIPVLEGIRKATDLVLDVHLMIERPIRYAEAFAKAGADYITIHLEADSADNNHACLKKIHELGLKAGIVIKPGTPAQALDEYLTEVDMVLVMTVEPGFGGQKFMADMMPKLTYLKEKLAALNPECLIEVDGGVDAVTAPICKENGANVLVSGSAFFKASDKEAFVKALSE